MSAIKKFFEDERTRKIRIREMKKVKQQVSEPVYQVDQTKLNNAFDTLKNWDVYFPEDLVNYYDNLDQEEYEYILEKKSEFPLNVQYILWGPPPAPRVGHASKMKVSDFTDAMYVEKKTKEQQAFEKQISAELEKHSIPNRPRDELDIALERLRTNLKDQEDDLEKLMKAPTKKYVAPSMRKQIMLADPEVQDKQKQIEKTKNEISLYESYIVDANNGWQRLKQLELRNQVIQEMLAV